MRGQGKAPPFVIKVGATSNSKLQAFQLVEKGPFCCLLTYLRPSLSDNDILHCKAVRQEIMKKAAATEAHLKDILKVFFFSLYDIYHLNSEFTTGHTWKSFIHI